MTNIFGTNLNDELFGTDLADVIKGLFGDDRIDSGEGDDTVEGNEGNDILKGDLGRDRIFRAGKLSKTANLLFSGNSNCDRQNLADRTNTFKLCSRSNYSVNGFAVVISY